MSRKVIIAGGTGYIGLNLADWLNERDFTPVLISRNKPKKALPYQHLQWDGRSLGAWAESLEGAAAVVNLAGRTVDCIKTAANCDQILRSRVESTRVIGQALQQITNRPPVWVQMSTAHIYGDSELRCTEDSAFGYGLAPTVGKAWEAEHLAVLPEGMRSVILRTSFVIGKNGGALPQLALLSRLGLGGKVGHGRQGISWIHEDDMSALLFRAISEQQMEGAYVASAPDPRSYRDFMRALRKQLRVPIGLPAASWMVRFGTRYLFKTDPELVLYGRFVVSQRLAEEGYDFRYPELESALQAIYGK